MVELKCPQLVIEDWHGVVKSIVKDRVKNLSREARVDLFCELEDRADTPDLLTNIFMTEAATALDELIFQASLLSCNTACVG